MYHSFFGIDEQAFSISVNPRYLYMSSQHREALAHLNYGINAGGFVMLTGEVGTGKTTLIRCLLEQLPEQTDVAMVINPAANAHDLLCSICDEFSIPYYTDEMRLKELHDSLLAFLLKNHQKGRRTIVLIDEAQLLQVSTLEQVRLLTNLESDTHKLLQIILVGQPELNDLLARPALRQLSQRITARYHLRPLNEQETHAYIRHRLTVAGLDSGTAVFSEQVAKRIATISGGIPRIINVLCDRMLLGAYGREQKHVDLNIVKQAAQEVMSGPSGAGLSLADTTIVISKRILIIAGSIVAVCLVVALWLGSQLRSVPAPALAQPQNAYERESKPVQPYKPELAKSELSEAKAESQSTSQSDLLEPDIAQDSPNQVFWIASKQSALTDVLVAAGGEPSDTLPACVHATSLGLQCETMKASTWTDLAEINRPFVLYLKSPSRFTVYTTVVGFDSEYADLVTAGNQYSVRLDKLDEMWTGEYTFVWHKPKGYKRPFSWQAEGEIIRWIARAFAKIDRQDRLLAKDGYNSSLSTRIKIFQGDHGLKQDGIVGLYTLLRLNEALNLDTTLIKTPKLSLPATGGQ